MRFVITFLILFIPLQAYAEKVRVWHKPDGSVSVTHCVGDFDRCVKRAQKSIKGLQGLPYQDMDSSELPSREYRDTWEKTPGGVSLNQQKKKSIQDKRTVDKRAKELIRKQAIDDLKAKGKISQNYAE